MTTILSFMEHLIKGAPKKQVQQVRTGDQAGIFSYYQKFQLASEFVLGMKDVLAISDHHQYGAPFLWYHTIGHIIRYAFIDYPSPGINYEKILVSRGALWHTHKATAKTVPGAIAFNWSNESGIGEAKPNDQCILVAWFEKANRCVFTASGGERRAGEAKLLVTGFRAQKAHTWIGFISADGKRIANSVYTGRVTIT